MKLKSLLTEAKKPSLLEKKEAIATSNNTNITLHYDADFANVGAEGTPQFSFTISMSSVGGKTFMRPVADKEEAAKLEEIIKLELRRALRKFDKRVQYIIDKHNLKSE